MHRRLLSDEELKELGIADSAISQMKKIADLKIAPKVYIFEKNGIHDCCPATQDEETVLYRIKEQQGKVKGYILPSLKNKLATD